MMESDERDRHLLEIEGGQVAKQKDNGVSSRTTISKTVVLTVPFIAMVSCLFKQRCKTVLILLESSLQSICRNMPN